MIIPFVIFLLSVCLIILTSFVIIVILDAVVFMGIIISLSVIIFLLCNQYYHSCNVFFLSKTQAAAAMLA